MTDHDYTTLEGIERAERAARPVPVTSCVYADFAALVVEAHNAEGRKLDALSFVRCTPRLTLEQRYAVARELPPWAQRNIDLWGDAA